MRNKNEFIGMSKSSIASQLRSLKDSIIHGAPHYTMDELTDENWLSWFWKNLKNLGNTHYPYPSYKNSNGIFKIPKDTDQSLTIALLSDWASDTPESHLIAEQSGTNDYSIHLGDTYYVGNEKEIGYNFKRDQGTWPYGTLGSFAMLGNHEMYSSGKSYFEDLLPWMGRYEQGNNQPVQIQEAAYFCLENENWRIICLDTGYWSLKGLLGLGPNLDLDLHDEQIQWLKNVVKPSSDNRGIIILSHHQCFSAFEDEFPNPAKTISNILGPARSVIWLWGHEHWLSIYGSNLMDNKGNVFARCIGNSGMPVELDRQGKGIFNHKIYPKVPKGVQVTDSANRNLVLYDNRQREVIDDDIPLGYNGYVLLTLKANNVVISYFDINEIVENNAKQPARKILEEEWMVDVGSGKLSGIRIQDFTSGTPKPLASFGMLDNAIK